MSERYDSYPPPRLVFWETTTACNLGCLHCRRPQASADASPNQFSTAEAAGMIDELTRLGAGILVLSGGEPLLRDDVFELATRASRAGLIVALATNGTLIDDKVVRSIQESGIRRVSVSLDGPQAAMHDAFRCQEGSFDQALQGIAALHEAGMPVQINTTVARHNADHLDDMVALAKRLGAVALHFFLLVPVGCGLEIAEEETITAETYERILHWLYDTERAEAGLQLKATCAPHYFRVVRQRLRSERVASGGVMKAVPSVRRQEVSLGAGGRMRPGSSGHPGDSGLHAATRGCLAGSGVCFVSHEGKVYGCGYLPIEAGDLRRESLEEIWRHSPLFAQLRDPAALKGDCGICEFTAVCGGCRARAYGVGGDYLGEEPFCSYDPRAGGGDRDT